MDADDLSDCDPGTRTDVCAVPDVTVVLGSPSSVVTGCFGDVSWHLDWECVQPQSSSLSKERLLLDSFTERDIEEGQWQIEVENQIWNASDRTAIARMEQYLEKKVTAR